MLATALAACASNPAAPAAEAHPYSTLLFGTRFELRLAGTDGEELDRAADAAFAEGRRLEALTSVWLPDSAVSRFNAAAAAPGRHPVPEELARVIERATAFCAASEGAFDPTVGALLESLGVYRGGGESPAPAELDAVLARVGCDRVTVLGGELVTRVPGVRLDLGGVAKGWAVDQMVRVLREAGVEHGIVSGGGSAVRAFGDEPGGRGWPLELDPGAGPQTWRLEDEAVAVSGQLTELVFLDGQLVSHIVDPRTGRPVEHATLQSIALADTATTADLGSTALLVLGSEAAATWLGDADRVPALRGAVLTDLSGRPSSGGREPERVQVRLREVLGPAPAQ